jgi:cysteine synthase
MLRDAGDKLAGTHTLVENSSGNTGFSLAIIGRLFGIRSVRAIVPIDIAPGKLELLRLAGADVRFAASEKGGVAMARRAGSRPGFFNLDQYSNSANVKAHAQWTASQVWQQTAGKLTLYAAGLGTTGTALGAVRYFHEHGHKVTVVGVYVLPNSAVPGVRSVERLQEISFDWETGVPHRVGAATRESYKKSLDLCRMGLLAGPSSGFALAGLLRFLGEHHDLDRFRNSDGEVVAAFICSDTPFPYLDKYSTILDPVDFSAPGALEASDEDM